MNIGDPEANIEDPKVNIEKSFTIKTAAHVCRLLKEFGMDTIFSRTDVQAILGLKATRSIMLLKEMMEKGFIESVTGHGKGKYRFISFKE